VVLVVLTVSIKSKNKKKTVANLLLDGVNNKLPFMASVVD